MGPALLALLSAERRFQGAGSFYKNACFLVVGDGSENAGVPVDLRGGAKEQTTEGILFQRKHPLYKNYKQVP